MLIARALSNYNLSDQMLDRAQVCVKEHSGLSSR